jgi:hypothetical protein
MSIVANIVFIAAVGIIAYWWANQGLFSALLHLVCVIVAGAVAFAFWEPLTTGVLLKGGFFDDYAWGVVLIVLFSVSLFIMRVAMDKIAPANVRVPQWASLTFGGAAGAASGVLSVGILIIGIGHIQSSNTLLGGIRGWARDGNKGAQVAQRDRLWVPFHQLTNEFYSFLSVSSLRSGQPMRQYAPDLYKQAVSEFRDSYGKGRGKVSLKPSAATVERLYMAPGTRGDRYFVKMRFTLDAHDYGEQLTLSNSQVRLVGSAAGSQKPAIVHPVAWRQYSGYHRFDDLTHYLSSEPGKESSEPTLEFETPAGFTPRFIVVRGTRYALPTEVLPAPANWATASSDTPEDVAPGGISIQSQIRVSNSIRPVNISTNLLPGTIQQTDNLLTSGEATFPAGRGFVNRTLRVEGIFEPTGTRCVRLDVSRDGPADIFRFRNQAGEGATLALVDSTGSEYTPIGFFYVTSSGTTINLAPTTRIRTIDQVPSLPTSGNHQLELLFYVTTGATITGFRFGDIDVGYCSQLVEPDDG